MPDLISRIVLWRVKCRSKDFYRITAGRERTYQSESVNRIKGGARYNFNGRPLTRWRTISFLFLYSFFFPLFPFPPPRFRFRSFFSFFSYRLLFKKIPRARHVPRNPAIKIHASRDSPIFYSISRTRFQDMSLDGFLNSSTVELYIKRSSYRV